MRSGFNAIHQLETLAGDILEAEGYPRTHLEIERAYSREVYGTKGEVLAELTSLAERSSQLTGERGELLRAARLRAELEHYREEAERQAAAHPGKIYRLENGLISDRLKMARDTIAHGHLLRLQLGAKPYQPERYKKLAEGVYQPVQDWGMPIDRRLDMVLGHVIELATAAVEAGLWPVVETEERRIKGSSKGGRAKRRTWFAEVQEHALKMKKEDPTLSSAQIARMLKHPRTDEELDPSLVRKWLRKSGRK